MQVHSVDRSVERGSALPRPDSRPWVLLAEDDFEMRRLVRAALEARGYRVREARDGSEALRCIGDLLDAPRSRVAPDVIVADVRMPRFDGLEVLEAARLVSPEIPVILVTAFGDAETHAQARRLGVNVFLDKPVDLHRLIDAVRMLVPPGW